MTIKPVVIHRDRTFEYQGEVWHVMANGPIGENGEYVIWRDRDGYEISGWFTIAGVREYINECAQNGWSLLETEQ